MNRRGGRNGSGGGYSTPRGRGRQSWRKVEADSPSHHHHQTPVGADMSSGRTLGSSEGKSHSSREPLGHGTGVSVSRNHDYVTPPGRRGRGKDRSPGWSTLSGQSYSSGHAKQYESPSVQSNSGDKSGNRLTNEVRGGLSEGASESSSLNLDQSLKDNLPDVSKFSEESAVVNSHSEAKDPESNKISRENENSEHSNCSVLLEKFDICPPKSDSGVKLKPSLLSMNRDKRNEMKRSIGGPKGEILRSGMVLWKNYLSSSEQAKILKTCRDHGLGPAGFYQPSFPDGGKLHLKLMCFGEFWDPETSKYGEVRPIDRAIPPPVPQEFLQLVDRAIKDSQSLIAEVSKVKNVLDILPPVKPDICLVNYYATTGKLGLHQDKDEGRESLGKGIPIVSFSIGDSAEFLYADQRDAEKPDKITLESGDVLIFGGKSRHIFHGVSSILPDTAPKSLLEESNFRAGRLNLTFRQHL